jgi:hypothetical protein
MIATVYPDCQPVDRDRCSIAESRLLLGVSFFDGPDRPADLIVGWTRMPYMVYDPPMVGSSQPDRAEPSLATTAESRQWRNE